jgi:hypothetical protein
MVSWRAESLTRGTFPIEAREAKDFDRFCTGPEKPESRNGADGTKVERYGTNPKGIAFFDSGGRYIITVMRSDRAKYASNALRRGIWSAIGGACIA